MNPNRKLSKLTISSILVNFVFWVLPVCSKVTILIKIGTFGEKSAGFIRFWRCGRLSEMRVVDQLLSGWIWGFWWVWWDSEKLEVVVSDLVVVRYVHI